MIKNFLNQQKQVSFSRIRKTIIFGFFLAGFLVVFLTIGLVLLINPVQNDNVPSDFSSTQGLNSLKSFLPLAFFIFTAALFVLYKCLAKPIMETVRSNFEERNRQAQQCTSILENTSDLIWAVDINFRLLAFNSSFVEMMKEETGTSPMLGESILEKNHSVLSFFSKKELYEKALSGESFETDLKSSKNGRTYYFELSFHPIYNKCKEVTGCSVFRKNISQRIEMYRELQKKEEYLIEAQEIANIGNWNWNMIKDEIQWSDQLYKMFGLNRQTFEANYEGLMNVIHPDDQEAFGVSIEKCLTNKDTLDIVHRIVMPDSSIRYVHQKGKVYFLDDETPARMAGTIQDVTQLEEARQQNTRQYNELQNFVYIISHNVRAPIATLQSLVDIIEPGNESLNAEIIPSIATTVNTLDQTIKDLNYSLSLKNVQENTFEEVDLRKVLKDIEHLLAIHLDSSKATIEYNLSKAPKVRGIKSYFTNILFNLVMNSIDYKAVDRPLHIMITSQPNLPEGMEIIVSDNGKGMYLNAEKRKRIFDMYGRLSGTTRGRGMGLYLAKTQVEVMNGTICVESEPNVGTTFKVVF